MKLKLFSRYEIHFCRKWICLRCTAAKNEGDRILYWDKEQKRRIEDYLSLAQERPELFSMSECIPICTDRLSMLEFEKKNPKALGLVYNNYPYQYILADLINGKGRPFSYLRVVPCSKEGGTIIIPCWRDSDGEEYIGLLSIYRHAPRKCSLEIPRGHLDPNLTPKENAEKELSEEFGVRKESILSIEELGISYPDTGLTSSLVRYYSVTISGPRPEASKNHEGIRSGNWYPKDKLLQMLRTGEITDGMTMNGLLLYQKATKD